MRQTQSKSEARRPCTGSSPKERFDADHCAVGSARLEEGGSPGDLEFFAAARGIHQTPPASCKGGQTKKKVGACCAGRRAERLAALDGGLSCLLRCEERSMSAAPRPPAVHRPPLSSCRVTGAKRQSCSCQAGVVHAPVVSWLIPAATAIVSDASLYLSQTHPLNPTTPSKFHARSRFSRHP